MSMNKKGLETVIDGVLSQQGFKKRGSTWYRQNAGTLQAVDLQKSAYGGQFYVNLCFAPEGMSVEGMPFPKVHKCPVWIRIGSAFADHRSQCEELFDLEQQGVAEAERTIGIQQILIQLVVPFFNQLRESNDLKLAIENGTFKGGAVTLAARKHLGIEP
jgi:hypothetical protein